MQPMYVFIYFLYIPSKEKKNLFPIYANADNSRTVYKTQADSELSIWTTSHHLLPHNQQHEHNIKGGIWQESAIRATGRTVHSQHSSIHRVFTSFPQCLPKQSRFCGFYGSNEGLIELLSSSTITSNGHVLLSAGLFWNFFLLCNMPSSPCNILTTCIAQKDISFNINQVDERWRTEKSSMWNVVHLHANTKIFDRWN